MHLCKVLFSNLGIYEAVSDLVLIYAMVVVHYLFEHINITYAMYSRI